VRSTLKDQVPRRAQGAAVPHVGIGDAPALLLRNRIPGDQATCRRAGPNARAGSAAEVGPGVPDAILVLELADSGEEELRVVYGDVNQPRLGIVRHRVPVVATLWARLHHAELIFVSGARHLD